MKRPWLFLTLAGLLGLVVGGCLGPANVDKVYKGRVLLFYITDVRLANQVGYQEKAINYVVEPQDPDHQLVLIQLRVLNQEAGQVSVSIGPQAATLVDKEGGEYRPLDARQRAVPVSEPLPNPSRVGIPVLWGDYSVSKGFEARGWLYFDVPKGKKLNYLSWESTDALRLYL